MVRTIGMRLHFRSGILLAGVILILEIRPNSWYLRFIARYTLTDNVF